MNPFTKRKDAKYNVIFCMDQDSEGVVQADWDRENPTQRTIQFDIEYEFIIVFSASEALQVAKELKAEGGHITVGFFDMCSKEYPNLRAISDIRKIFPEMICCISAQYTQVNYMAIAKVFNSAEEWLYFSHPLTQGEMKQTIRNLLTLYKNRDDRNAAMNSLKASKEGMRRILDSSPDLLKIRPLEELYDIILDHGSQLTGAEHAFLAILNEKGELHYVSGNGRFDSQEVFEESGYGENLYFFQQVLNEGKIMMMSYGSIIPLRVRHTQVGILFTSHHPEPVEIEILDLFASQAAFAIDNIRLHLQLEHKKALENEMSYAAQLQNSLLPKKIPHISGIELAGMMISAKEVGGDYYDFIEVAQRSGVYIGIGDVSGKGLAAGMLMSTAHSVVRAFCETLSTPKEVMLGIGRLMEHDLRRAKKFISMLLLHFIPEKQALIWSSAGHEHILHWKASEKKVTMTKSGGVVLGTPYNLLQPLIREHTLPLKPGDMLLLFTDGVTEARNPQTEMFTLAYLKETFETLGAKHPSPQELIDAIYEKLSKFTKGAEQHDDITLVALRAIPLK